MTTPALPIEWIQTEDRHRAAFARRHPLEAKIPIGIGIRGGELALESLERREIYTLSNEDLSPLPVSVDVTNIRRAMSRGAVPYKMILCHHSQAWHDYVLQSCGVEEKHLSRLTREDLERPAILMNWHAMWVTSTIDGAHRIVRRWRDGLRTFEMAVVRYEHVIEFVWEGDR